MPKLLLGRRAGDEVWSELIVSVEATRYGRASYKGCAATKSVRGANWRHRARGNGKVVTVEVLLIPGAAANRGQTAAGRGRATAAQARAGCSGRCYLLVAVRATSCWTGELMGRQGCELRGCELGVGDASMACCVGTGSWLLWCEVLSRGCVWALWRDAALFMVNLARCDAGRGLHAASWRYSSW